MGEARRDGRRVLAGRVRASGPGRAQAPAAKPNILFIMDDDIGWMQIGIYDRGLALGETQETDR